VQISSWGFGAKGFSAKSPDSCRGAALDTDVRSGMKLVCESDVDNITPLGVRSTGSKREDGEGSFIFRSTSDSAGVETKYITRKKLRKFLRIKTNAEDKSDFVLVLSNRTIREVATNLKRQDEPDNLSTVKEQRYLETDWKTFEDNPAFDLDPSRDPALAMYRHQWRQSPGQHLKIVRWVEEMVIRKRIRPSRNKWYVKLAKCVFCTPEIRCLGDFVGRDMQQIPSSSTT
ncbi:TPA: hypothetical protein N0F65_005401, partial [Lagenidium giganteum]